MPKGITPLSPEQRADLRQVKLAAMNYAIEFNKRPDGSNNPADVTKAARAFERYLKVD